MTKLYDPRQIREVFLNLGYNEVEGEGDDRILFFINRQRIAKLRISLRQERRGHRHETIDKFQVQLICENNHIPFEQFDSLYKRAKKHKKL